MKAARILNDLAEMDAVLTDGHFIFSSGNHGSAYIDIRTVAPDAAWMKKVAGALVKAIEAYDYDVIIGPETLGRDLARFGSAKERRIGLWCNIVDATDDTPKHAIFPPKLERVFRPLIDGMRVAIFDDLLTTGGRSRWSAISSPSPAERSWSQLRSCDVRPRSEQRTAAHPRSRSWPRSKASRCSRPSSAPSSAPAPREYPSSCGPVTGLRGQRTTRTTRPLPSFSLRSINHEPSASHPRSLPLGLYDGSCLNQSQYAVLVLHQVI